MILTERKPFYLLINASELHYICAEIKTTDQKMVPAVMWVSRARCGELLVTGRTPRLLLLLTTHCSVTTQKVNIKHLE